MTFDEVDDYSNGRVTLSRERERRARERLSAIDIGEERTKSCTEDVVYQRK